MGSVIEFPSGGSTDVGYLASPAGGSGPGVVVIQEWWGLVGHIKDVCDRFAAEGFVALAPDLYHGAKAAEPGEAAKLMMALELDRAGSGMGGVVVASPGGGLASDPRAPAPRKGRRSVPFFRSRPRGGR